jgi:class 3 adenylate cyclase/tetratricopeptide (TPR) repeat protein
LGCGARLGLRCSSCGSDLPADSRFCNKCGHAIALQADSDRRLPSPDAYTPKHLAERILNSKAALEGERKQVTVLFADLKGSMELLADRDPEDARKLLDPVLERMMEAVHHYEGTVNQVMGDGIMALFGAPVAHEDHAVRACYAALRMQRRVNLYADEIQRRGGTPVQIRVGANSGEVVVRAIGNDLHMDYTAVGQTTHLAARMEQMAKPGSALITGATLNLAEGYVQVRPLGAVPVKGLEMPTSVYELTGVVAAQSRFHASAARGLTRFVGRDTELQQLGHALDRAAAGHGQAVAVVGEAGVGKSRLAWEFARSHRTQGWLVLESASVSYGKATPYLPLVELLKAYCRIQERDEPREIRERVAGKLLMLDRALEPLLTPLLALLDVPVEDAAWAALDPPQRRQRTLDAIKRLLLRESQVQPLLLIVEDLHWIDAETQALLDGLMESLPTARILLLVNYRPEYQHTWGGKTYYLQQRIDPLPPESADSLLSALLGEDRAFIPLKQMLVARTEGNPFFLEESVRTFVETQVLVGKRGAYRLAKAPDAWQIPATVQAILGARIDRLPPEDKGLLQAAAVVGKDVPFALLQAIADMPEDHLRRALLRLQSAEFLYETSLFPDLEYTFKHAFTHEVAYGSVLQDRRRTLHARIVDAIERLYPDRLAEHVERLAHHALRGEHWDRAVTYLRRAGLKATDRSAHRAAVTFFEEALGALAHLPTGPDTLEQAIDIRLDMRASLQPLGEIRRLQEYLEQAEGLAERLRDPRRLGLIAAFTMAKFIDMGYHDRAAEAGRRALALANTRDDAALRTVANYHLGQVSFFQGNYRDAIDAFRSNVTDLESDRLRERFGMSTYPAVTSRSQLAWVLADLGQFDEAVANAAEALRQAEVLDHPYSLIMVSWNAAQVHLLQGGFQLAVSLCERAVDLCRLHEIPRQLPPCVVCLGTAYAALGRHVEAAALLDQGAALLAAGWTTTSLFTRELAGAYLAIGHGARAGEIAAQGLAIAAKQEERGLEAWLLRLLGELAVEAASPDLESADARYRQALAIADELGMYPLVAHCHLGLGKLYRRKGDPATASEHLTSATTMYREMGMTFWLDRAAGALKEVG